MNWVMFLSQQKPHPTRQPVKILRYREQSILTIRIQTVNLEVCIVAAAAAAAKVGNPLIIITSINITNITRTVDIGPVNTQAAPLAGIPLR